MEKSKIKQENIQIGNGLLIFYIDVGLLPPEKATAFVEKIKKDIDIDKLKEKVFDVFFIPIRPNSKTRVEYIPFN